MSKVILDSIILLLLIGIVVLYIWARHERKRIDTVHRWLRHRFPTLNITGTSYSIKSLVECMLLWLQSDTQPMFFTILSHENDPIDIFTVSQFTQTPVVLGKTAGVPRHYLRLICYKEDLVELWYKYHLEHPCLESELFFKEAWKHWNFPRIGEFPIPAPRKQDP